MIKSLCTAENCTNTNIAAKGLCHKHYRRGLRNNGDISDPVKANELTCYADGCELSSHTGGLCRKHYARWLRHGNTSTVDRLPSYDGETCVIGDCVELKRARDLCNKHYSNFQYHKIANGILTAAEYVEWVNEMEVEA